MNKDKKIEKNIFEKFKTEAIHLGAEELLEKNIIEIAIDGDGQRFGFTLKNYIHFRLIILGFTPINRKELLKKTEYIAKKMIMESCINLGEKSPAMLVLRSLIELEISIVNTPQDNCLRFRKSFDILASAKVYD